MIRAAVDFRQIQGASRTRAHAALLVRYRRNELGRTRFGISTGRRVGSAVVRNRIRRRLREVLRTLSPHMELGWDVLIVARPPAAEASQAQLASILERLFQQAGLLNKEAIGRN
jgi:ribonuclease P protein component